MHCIIIGALLAAASAPALALNRCVDANGNVSLQDLPCESGQAQTTIRTAPPPAQGEAAAESPYKRHIERFRRKEALENAQAERDTRVYNAILRKVVVVGMTEDELTRAQGRPEKINSGSHGPAQWVYADGRFAKYVYVEGGVVKSFQSR